MSDQINFISAIRQISAERKIDVVEILTAIKQALKAGYKNEYGVENLDNIEVDIEPEAGRIVVFYKKLVVKKVVDPSQEISVEDARKIMKNADLGDLVLVDVTPEGDFGRIAAQTARQIILQKLRESEKESAIRDIKDSIGRIETVFIQRFIQNSDLLCEINKAKAIMPKGEQVPTEFYRLGSRIKVLLKNIEEDAKGKYIVVSRADNGFLKELFRMEVPEIDSGTVEIVSIARQPGIRAKVAVKSNASGVDPIGACVGQKGVRINTISNELKLGNFEEKLDIILWDENIITFLANAIRPAESLKIEVVSKENREAIIVVPDDQLSLAIGKDGINVSLAAKLTGWRIDIKSDTDFKEWQAQMAPAKKTVKKVEEVGEVEVEVEVEVEEKEEGEVKEKKAKAPKKVAAKKEKAVKVEKEVKAKKPAAKKEKAVKEKKTAVKKEAKPKKAAAKKPAKAKK